MRVLGDCDQLDRTRGVETPDLYWLDFAHITAINRELVSHGAKFDPEYHDGGIPTPGTWGRALHFLPVAVSKWADRQAGRQAGKTPQALLTDRVQS